MRLTFCIKFWQVWPRLSPCTRWADFFKRRSPPPQQPQDSLKIPKNRVGIEGQSQPLWQKPSSRCSRRKEKMEKRRFIFGPQISCAHCLQNNDFHYGMGANKICPVKRKPAILLLRKRLSSMKQLVTGKEV